MLKVPRKLIQETKALCRLQLFLQKEVGIKKAFSVGQLKRALKTIGKIKKRA